MLPNGAALPALLQGPCLTSYPPERTLELWPGLSLCGMYLAVSLCLTWDRLSVPLKGQTDGLHFSFELSALWVSPGHSDLCFALCRAYLFI